MIYKNSHKDDIGNVSELIFDLSNAIVSFSDIVKRAKSSDIYSGIENIPFQKREHEYKLILKQEFVTA